MFKANDNLCFLPADDIQVGCRQLRAKRYISDGFCTSTKPINEVVCAGNCLPIRQLPWYSEFVKYWSNDKLREWECEEDMVRRKKVRLLCQDKTYRTYKIKVVKSCKCKKTVDEHNKTKQRKKKKKRRRRKNNKNNRRQKRKTHVSSNAPWFRCTEYCSIFELCPVHATIHFRQVRNAFVLQLDLRRVSVGQVIAWCKKHLLMEAVLQPNQIFLSKRFHQVLDTSKMCLMCVRNYGYTIASTKLWEHRILKPTWSSGINGHSLTSVVTSLWWILQLGVLVCECALLEIFDLKWLSRRRKRCTLRKAFFSVVVSGELVLASSLICAFETITSSRRKG